MAKDTERPCPTCGRPVPPKKTHRGPPKIYHKECRVLESRLREVASLLELIRFKPPVRKGNTNAMLGHAKEMRSTIQDLWRAFTVKSIKTSTLDTEYYDEWEAAKRRRKSK